MMALSEKGIALKERINEMRAKQRNLSIQEVRAALNIQQLIKLQSFLEDEIIMAEYELDKERKNNAT